jgi:hypothetical protein
LESAVVVSKVFIPLILKQKAAAFWLGFPFFFLSTSIIAVRVELTCHWDVVA